MKVRILVTGVSRDIVASNGKKHTFSEIWVAYPGLPYPSQVDHYGEIDLAPGEYDVPIAFRVRDGRVAVQHNFKSAVPAKAAV